MERGQGTVTTRLTSFAVPHRAGRHAGRRAGRHAGAVDDRGIAMVTVTMVSLVLFSLLAVIVLPFANDVSTAIRAHNVADARALADTVMNELFSQVRGDASALPAVNLAGRVAPGKQISSAGPLGGWASWDHKFNKIVPCPSLRSDCFYYSLSTAPVVTAATRDYVIAEVTTRSGCGASSTVGCVYRRFQQRWHRRRLVDYVLFTDEETLAPELYPAAEQAAAKQNCENRRPPLLAGNPPAGSARATSCREVSYVGFGTPTTLPTEAYVAEYWPNRGALWSLTDVPVTTVPGTPRTAGPSAQSAAVAAAPITKGALHLASRFVVSTAGRYTLSQSADESSRLTYRLDNGSTGTITTNTAALDLAKGAGVTIEQIVLDNDPSRVSSSIQLAAPSRSPIELDSTNAATLGVSFRTKSLNAGFNRTVGDIHTNDPWFWVCGSPHFTGLVESARPQPYPSPAQPLKAFTQSPDCKDQSVVSPSNLVHSDVIALPTSVTPFLSITPALYRFGQASIVLNGTSMTVTPAVGAPTTLPVPNRGTVYVAGDVSISGKATGITIASTGSVTIAGDLLGTDIGLVATKSILISYTTGSRTVEASMLALGGVIRTEGYDTMEVPLASVPVLVVHGAMVSKYHPVIGSFDAKAGLVLKGMVADVSYPATPPSPPYFLEPVSASWERVDFTEVGLGGGGITPAPDRTVTAATAGCGAPGDGIYLRSCLAP